MEIVVGGTRPHGLGYQLHLKLVILYFTQVNRPRTRVSGTCGFENYFGSFSVSFFGFCVGLAGGFCCGGGTGRGLAWGAGRAGGLSSGAACGGRGGGFGWTGRRLASGAGRAGGPCSGAGFAGGGGW